MIRLHDFLTTPEDRNGTNDVTAKVQAAADASLAAFKRGDDSTLELGHGNYRLNPTGVIFGTRAGDGGGYFANIYGRPGQTTFFCNEGAGTMFRFNDLWSGTVRDFSLRGPGQGNGVGMLIGASHVDLGTARCTFANIGTSDFRYGWSFGESEPPTSAAAEIIVDMSSATRCTTGFMLGQWNTMDVVFNLCAASHCGSGWTTNNGAGNAAQLTWVGGSSVSNGHDFELWGQGPFLIRNFRCESWTETEPMILMGGGHVVLEGVHIADSVGKPVAVKSLGGSFLELRHCNLTGGVELDSDWANTSTLIAHQNVLFVPDGQYFKFDRTGLKHDLFGNIWAPQAAGGFFGGHLADERSGFVSSGGTGVPGPAGPAGPAGKDGAAGPIGPKGIQGEPGNPGPKGDRGDKGDPGERGLKGDTGISGSRGATGPAGPGGKLEIRAV